MSWFTITIITILWSYVIIVILVDIFVSKNTIW